MAANVTRSFYAPEKLTIKTIESVLLLIGEKLPPGWAKWTELEKLMVFDWAIRIHLRASDNPTRLRERPSLMGPDPRPIRL